MIKQSHIFFTISSVAFVFYACQPNPKPQDDITTNEKDSIILDTLEIQKQFHPEAPEKLEFDTTIKIGGNTYSIHTIDMTLDNDFVAYIDTFQGNKLMNLYADRKFIVEIKNAKKVFFSDTITKEKYAAEYMDDFIGRSILHSFAFNYFDDDMKEFVFNFRLSKPDTDYTDEFMYRIDMNGKSNHEIKDIN